MKYLKVGVSRKAYTDLYIEVSDDYDVYNLIYNLRSESISIAKIARDTTNSSDWDDYGWENDIEIEDVETVEKSEAEQYRIGKL